METINSTKVADTKQKATKVDETVTFLPDGMAISFLSGIWSAKEHALLSQDPYTKSHVMASLYNILGRSLDSQYQILQQIGDLWKDYEKRYKTKN
jgi:hypothetical protein